MKASRKITGSPAGRAKAARQRVRRVDSASEARWMCDAREVFETDLAVTHGPDEDAAARRLDEPLSEHPALCGGPIRR